MSNTFEWIEFPEGRARFSGICRGWDERGRHTFALELHGREYFGEIRSSFPDNDENYCFLIDDFGYALVEAIGIPGTSARKTFTRNEEGAARALIVKLVRAGFGFEDPPSVFFPEDIAHFTGEILFQEGWILVGMHPSGEVG